MPFRKASEFPVLASPSSTARVLMLDPGTSATDNYLADAAALNAWLGRVTQAVVAAGQTLALTFAAHQGATIVLNGAGATVSFSAAAQGDGFAVKVINRSGSDWTVPAFAGGTHDFDAAGHTKVASGGSASLEVYTRGSTRYVHVSGTTTA